MKRHISEPRASIATVQYNTLQIYKANQTINKA